MHFFSQKKSLIAWNVDRINPRYIKEFYVFEKNPEDFEPPFIRKMSFTTGNCWSDWNSLNEIQLTLEISGIFYSHNFHDNDFRIKCLIQCGQIIELENFRIRIKNLYFSDMSMKEFETFHYGETIDRLNK